MTCLFVNGTWECNLWSKILNLAIYRQLIHFQTIHFTSGLGLCKCQQKNDLAVERFITSLLEKCRDFTVL